MKNIHWHPAVVTAVAGLLFTQLAVAQGPSGSITSPTFRGAGQGLYDLTGVLTNFSENFSSSQGTAVTISEGIRLVESITGVLSAGSTTTTVTLAQDAASVELPLTYTIKGAAKSSAGNVLVTLAFAGKGSIVSNGITAKYSEALTYLVTIDPNAGTLSGRKTGTASKSGPNGGTVKLIEKTFSHSIPPELPVDWNLNLTLASAGGKVTGTATVSLANARNFPFTVKGTTKAGASKLTLTGTGAGKGAKLTVTLTGNNITGCSGSLLGQKISITVLPT